MITSPDSNVAPKVDRAHAPIRIGVVGLNFGRHMAEQIMKNVDCLEVVGVCEVDQTTLHRVARDLQVKAYSDLDLMLADPEIEAIALFSGCNGRASLISRILKHNRHVLTTKPFELEVDDTEKVLREARERGMVVHLNSPAPRPAEDTATIRRWIRQYDLGRPIGFHGRTWASYREKANGSWYDDQDKCAAAPILRLGVYFLNEFASFMGKPSRVHVVQSRIFTQRPTSDNAHMTIEFEGGAIGSIFSSFCIDDGRPWRDEISLSFQNGTVNRWMERFSEYDMGRDVAITELMTRNGSPVCGSKTQPGAFAGWYQWESFQRAIREGEGTTEKYSEEILYGVRLLQAMRLSALHGKPQPVQS